MSAKQSVLFVEAKDRIEVSRLQIRYHLRQIDRHMEDIRDYQNSVDWTCENYRVKCKFRIIAVSVPIVGTVEVVGA